MVPLGLMTGAEVGIAEKKQGRFTFPEREPVTGLMIDKELESAWEKEKSASTLQIQVWCVYTGSNRCR